MTEIDTADVSLWDKLESRSQRLLDDIASTRIDGHDDVEWYVRRDIEADLLERVLRSGSEPQILVGEAGHGKSTLLWSLHRALSECARSPLLVSAAWLQRDASGGADFSNTDIVSAIRSRPGAMLLLDTADLLLHDRSARDQVVDLIDELARAGVPIVLTTRPQEARSLPAALGRKVVLGPYAPHTELPAALEALIGEFTADRGGLPERPVEAIQSARARGTLVDEVCTSPLLLRLLFSLSAPEFPHLELDVTELYELFWERRIVTDHRLGKYIYRGDADDLSDTAGFLGIAMLALGTPEPPLDALVRRAAHVAAASDQPIAERELRTHVHTLVRRGVLIATGDRVRFLHQTFFEYAAARGLAARGADDELHRVIERLAATPDDLFLGAVAEQLLIVMGSDPLAQPAVRDSCRTLLESPHPSVVSIGMTTWAHHPDLFDLSVSVLEAMPPDQLHRFLRTVPRVHSHTDSVARHLALMWEAHPRLHTSIVTTAAQLAGRAPTAMAALVRATEMYSELVRTELKFLQSNHEPRTLLELLAPTTPDLARAGFTIAIDGLAADTPERAGSDDTRASERRRQGKHTIARYLQSIAEHWAWLHGSDFLNELRLRTTSMQAASNDSDAVDVRDALASVVAADLKRRLTTDWRALQWIEWVVQVCSALDAAGGDQDPVVGADLIALGMMLRTFRSPADDPTIEATLDRLFALSSPAAPRQLARGCLKYVLTEECPAREAVIGRLSAMIDTHLPAEHQNFTLGEHLWAAVARSVLMDAAIPAPIVYRSLTAAAATYRSNDSLWRAADHLVALAPAALVCGDSAAQAAVDALAQVKPYDDAGIQAANLFLVHARNRAAHHPQVLVPAGLPIAHRINRTGFVKDLLLRGETHHVLITHTPRLEYWIEELVTGGDRQQQQGSALLRLLVGDEILTPSVDTLVDRLERLTDPKAKADLLLAIGVRAQQTDTIDRAIALLSTYVSVVADPVPAIAPHPDTHRSATIAEAARTALLELLTHEPNPPVDTWPTVYGLTFAPRLLGTQQVDVAGFWHLARFIRFEAERGRVDDALEHLHRTCLRVADLSKKLAHNASNRMKGAVSAVLRRAQEYHYDTLAGLVDIAPSQTSTQLIHGLLDNALFAHRAQELGHRLRVRPRVIGTGTFPEILDPVGDTTAPPRRTVTESDRSVPEGQSRSVLGDGGLETPDAAARVGAAFQRFVDRRREFMQATNTAFDRLEQHFPDMNRTVRAERFGVSRTTFEKLIASKYWRPPNEELCRRIDAVGSDIGCDFGLVSSLRSYETAEQDFEDASKPRLI
ncbi:hypothetical protein [Rhodococcoides kyotonense]|uniref:Uncharacterized protein n=2 Tax=Bacteria TaxID=2 RepID=A0A177YL75_9NOCA|nr:hypothetical protein [Rhodococcus kyotonensis]OAK56245.1 hypothetical protein A3K89_17400 [Rhodococcus kyotonensis]